MKALVHHGLDQESWDEVPDARQVDPTGAVPRIDPDVSDKTDSGSTQFTIGADVGCEDGLCGVMSRVVVDPIARVVTHLVVEPRHHRGLGRLVPLDLVDTGSREIALSCTLAEFDKLDTAEETEFLPGNSGYARYGPGEAVYWPHYGLSMGGLSGMGSTGMGQWLGAGEVQLAITYDAIPLGEVAIRRGEQVRATDGDIGRVEGLVVDTATHQVTHVLLQKGHLWGHKDVAIPIRAVTRVDKVIELNMAKQELAELPSIRVDHPESLRTRS
ncbi:MAG: PRC-barrel domain-containing protein [Acidimicrobiales bacterium]|jgi:sporulation protein YlmC with PRC-barrel domain